MRVLLFFFLLLNFTAVFAQNQKLPKREFRGVWIANVVNVDWPSKKGLDKEVQQKELIKIYDLCAKNNFNAVIVQVRPAADALFKSKNEPWSEWLTGTQGEKPGYDPLKFMIKEAHKRGLEFHAWFNPYRAIFNDKSSIAENHISKKHPEWLVKYGKGHIFDPSLPAVRKYVVDVISEVAERYDVDGIHFDDYFYPYPEKDQPFPDSLTFEKYRGRFDNLDDWRRNNIDQLIQDVSIALNLIKPHIKFGVSPFGVWRNKADDPEGSETKAGAPTYDILYADSRKWMQEGWVDYILPQVYWSMDFAPAAFSKLTDWWAENAFNRHVYMGHGTYKVNANFDSAWYRPEEIPKQVRYTRTVGEQVLGSAFFSAKSLLQNPNGFVDSLGRDLYKYPALLPVMQWKNTSIPNSPRKVKVKRKNAITTLKWKKPKGDTPFGYAIYRFKADAEYLDFEDPKYLVKCLLMPKRKYTDSSIVGNYIYYITAIDRLYNESIPTRQN